MRSKMFFPSTGLTHQQTSRHEKFIRARKSFQKVSLCFNFHLKLNEKLEVK